MEKEDIVIKAWQDNSWQEIADAPVDALRGVSAGDAEKLDAAFNVETVRDLATLKFVRWAQEIVRLADNPDGGDGPVTPEVARGVVETHYFNDWTARYAAYKNGEDYDVRFLDQYRHPRAEIGSTPSAVQAAHQYYLENVEYADWGGVSTFLLPIDKDDENGASGPSFYLVRVTTDGDDGWVELYAADGSQLGVGRTYIELIGWGDEAEIRAQVHSGDFPESLADRQERTLWGK